MKTQTIAGDFTVSETISLDQLILQEDAKLFSPEGKQLTLVVDGIQRDPLPGTYTGDIQIVITDDVTTPITGKSAGRHDLTGALVLTAEGVDDNSVRSAYVEGKVTTGQVNGGKITSHGNYFDGVIVQSGTYSIDDLTIESIGHGDDDFAGHGVGVIVGGDSQVVFDNLKLYNQGIQRNAMIAAGTSTVTVRNSDIKVMGGTPEQIQEFSKVQPKKAQQAFFCGGWGTTRAVNLINGATLNFENSTIQSENWGVLATDDTTAPEQFGDYTATMNVDHCKVGICGDHGYGTYAIGATDIRFHHSEISTPDTGAKIANEYAKVSISDSNASCGRFLALFKDNQGGGLYCRNSRLYSGRTMIVVPSCYPEIYMENCQIRAGNNTILQLYDNDNPGGPKGYRDVDNVEPVKDPEHDVTRENYHDVKMFSFDVKDYCTDCRATFKDMDIFGNFYNSITNAQKPMNPFDMKPKQEGAPPKDGPAPGAPQPPNPQMKAMMAAMNQKTYPQNLVLNFNHTNIKGIISSSRSFHAVDRLTPDTRQEIFQVYDRPCEAVNNGVIVNLEHNSSWTVWGRSYITALRIDKTSCVKAPDGSPILMTVDGVETIPEPDHQYTGNIIVTIR